MVYESNMIATSPATVSNPYSSPLMNKVGLVSPVKFGLTPKSNLRMIRACMWVAFALIECLCLTLYHHTFLSINIGPIHINDAPVKVYEHPNTSNSGRSILDKFQAKMEHTVDISRRTRAEKNDVHVMSEEEKQSLVVYERGYPKNTHLVDYSTSAAEREIEKHDRMLVQGFYFMKTHDFSQYVNVNRANMGGGESDSGVIRAVASASQNEKEGGTTSASKICINIYVCNRRMPYINALLMGLTAYSKPWLQEKYMPFKSFDGSTGREIPQNDSPYAQINFLNTEKRPNRLHFKYMRETLSKLPFIHSVHNITYHDEIYNTEEAKNRELTFREMFISDEISGLKICLESGLKYCLMMEEDAVVPVDFLHLIETQVIQPLERRNEEISVLSLYSYYNLVFFGPNRLHTPQYTKTRYDGDRSKGNSERYSTHHLPPYAPTFDIREKEYMYGTVAMLYSRESAQRLVEYLQKVGVNPIHNADEFMNAKDYFPAEMNVPRKHTQPSLINHIGYYSERMADVKSRGMFSQLNTDVRFMFDAGEEIKHP